jgi:hypothetical protein
MNVRSKVAAGTIAMALVAMVSNGRTALAKSSAPNVLAQAPPTYLISARGLSVDGIYYNDACSFCENGATCGCFFSDTLGGGSGFFQFSNSGATPLEWTIELDYNAANYIQTTDENSACIPASGFGSGTQLAGRKVNTFEFETTGLICNTANGLGTFTGSYILDGGSGAYSNATGSGSLTIGVEGNYNAPGEYFSNEVQFTGNLGQ